MRAEEGWLYGWWMVAEQGELGGGNSSRVEGGSHKIGRKMGRIESK